MQLNVQHFECVHNTFPLPCQLLYVYVCLSVEVHAYNPLCYAAVKNFIKAQCMHQQHRHKN